MNFTSKLPYIKDHIFSYMTGLANQYHALNLSQGFPNFETDGRLIKKVEEALTDGQLPLVNQYAPMIGLPALRNEIGHLMSKVYGIHVDVESEVTITVGATEAIFNTIAAFVWPDDEVILIEPCYDCYRPAVDMVRGKAVVYKMQAPDFRIDWQVLKQLITPKTRMICISTPNNPTATILTASDIQSLADIVSDTDIIVMSDEVYEHMVYDGHLHHSPLAHQALRERTVAVYSFGKTLHITGWRIGYCIASPKLTAELRKVHQNVVFGASHPLQKAIAAYMNEGMDYEAMTLMYQRKRDLFLSSLAGSRFDVLPCEGSYFLLLDYSAISDEGDFDFCTKLVKEYGVAAIPISRLYSDGQDDKLIRICFAKTDDVLIAAGERLKQVV
jgi:methionine transaminase